MAFTFITITPLATLHANLQDPEATYFESIAGLKPIELTVAQTTAVYANRNRGAHLKNFLKGEKVHLVAYAPKTVLVKNLKTNYSGWVPVENLSKIDEKALSSAIAYVEEQKKYQAAIDDKTVLAGMTMDHVKAAMGKPDEAAFRTDASGRVDVWSYIEYRSIFSQQPYIDRSTGQQYTRTFREKIPESEKTIEFTNGRVTAIEKKLIR